MKNTLYFILVSFISTSFSQTLNLETDFYKNGQKRLETFEIPYYKEGNSKVQYTRVRYVNMWQTDGKQILNNGNGIYYTKEPPVDILKEGDSLVYEIKDSIKYGAYRRYRLYRNSNYFLVETGQYDKHSIETGTFIFRDTVRLVSSNTHFENDKEISNQKYFYTGLRIKEEGQTINRSKEGLWKYYNQDGTKNKEVYFKNNTEFGEYKEFHPNGVLAVSGQYTHVTKRVMTSFFDASGNEYKKKTSRDNIPKKIGPWNYFDINGKLLKTVTFK